MTKRNFTEQEREAIDMLERLYDELSENSYISTEECIKNFAEKEIEMLAKKTFDEVFDKIVNENVKTEEINWVKCKKGYKK